MKRPVLFFFLATLTIIDLNAQGLPGEYSHKSNTRELTIKFETPFQNSLKGILIDETGLQYSLEGNMTNQNTTSGTLYAAQGGTMFYQAQVNGNLLTFTLVPAGQDQQPDYQNASEYAFIRNEVGISSLQPPSPGSGITGKQSISGMQNISGGWSDSFSGSVNGTPSVLKLQQNGNEVQGTLDAQGYIYNVKGTVIGSQSQGQLTDTRTGGVTNFAAILQGNNLNFNLVIQNQYGQPSQIPIQFTRGQQVIPGQQAYPGQQSAPSQQTYPGQQAFPGQSGQPVNQGHPGQPVGQGYTNPDQNVQRDQRVIGGWRHTESYTSGEFSMVSEWYLNINMDGTYTYGNGQAAGGDAGYSFDSGQGGTTSRGQWKTENSIIYINEGYGWQPYAGYYVEGSSMMFKFNDGSKQLWERFR